MSKFENIVRPVVMPNIRPQKPRSLPPADDPEAGFCVIKGNGATVVDLSYSFSMSMSKSRSVETMRRVDLARVYQVEEERDQQENGDEEEGGGVPSGAGGGRKKVNKENFIDVEVASKIKSREGAAPRGGNMPPKVNNYGGQMTRGDILKERFFKRQEPALNVEILDRDLTRKNPNET